MRLILILLVILKLSSTQVDYNDTFYQSPIFNDIYIDITKGCQQLKTMGIPNSFKENYVLKLNQTFYGLRDSPRNFFKYLEGKLEEC